MDKQKQINRLLQVTDQEWKAVFNSLYKFAAYRCRGRMSSGALSERQLGEPAVEHFTHEAISKLWTCQWEWNHLLSLEEQLKRIVVSMISEAIRKYKSNSQPDSVPLNENIVAVTEDGGKDEFREWLRLVAEGDNDLERYVEALIACNSPREMASMLNVSPKEIYNMTKRMKRKLDTEKLL